VNKISYKLRRIAARNNTSLLKQLALRTICKGALQDFNIAFIVHVCITSLLAFNPNWKARHPALKYAV